MAKIAPKLNKVSPKMAKIIHIWSKWQHVRETLSKSYCQPKILLAARLLGFTTFSWSARLHLGFLENPVSSSLQDKATDWLFLVCYLAPVELSI